ncbi:MAG: adenylyltransferase/cytidyltransferase family protein [Elusimicrobia bacterium]|nr:adenylyltransferase/cytidyltransferase family protein [Elusimicrobiota bacterium]
MLKNSSNRKIQTRKALQNIIKRLKKQSKKIVFTNGCFDLLHLGHILLFKKAKSCGDILVLGLNTDESAKRLKGPKRPLVDERSRARVLSELESIDYITFFNEDTPFELIKELKPNILVKGGDYRLNEIVGRNLVEKVVRFPFVEGYSTTSLIKKIVQAYGK